MSVFGARGEVRWWPLAWIWWIVVGAAIGFGIVGLLTVGVPFLALGLVMAVAGAVMPRTRNRLAFMAVAGASAAPLTLAWLNRSGPGTLCETNGDETTCIEQWSPWPFVAVAIVLVATGVVLATRKGPDSEGSRS